MIGSDDTRGEDIGAPEHAVVLGDLDPGKLAHPVLINAPPGLKTTAETDPALRLEARLDALSRWPLLMLAMVHVVVLRPGRVTIGVGRAGGGAELEIDSATLSRRHGELGRGGGDRWFVVDFDSSNGTFIEDRRLPANIPAAVESGDLVRLGQHAAIFLLPDAVRALLSRPARPAADARTPGAGVAKNTATLELGPAGVSLLALGERLAAKGVRLADIQTPFLLQVPTVEEPPEVAEATPVHGIPPDARKERPTRPIPIEELRRLRRGQGLGGARVHAIHGARVVVGRGAGCDLLLPAEVSASRQHAALSAGASGWTVVDLDSRNGTFVNGRRVPPGVSVPLKDEFQLWFGGYRAIFLSSLQLERLLAGV